MAKKATKKKAAPKGAKAASKADDFRSHSADELSSQLSNLKKEQRSPTPAPAPAGE